MALDPAALDNMAHVDEDGSLVAELVRLYHTDSRTLVANLRTAWAAADVSRLGAVAHTLKSASGLVGAVEVSTRAQAIEVGCRERGALPEETAIASVETAYADACAALTSYLAARADASARADRPDPATGTAC